GGQEIDHQVETWPVSQSKNGSVAEDRWVERFVFRFEQGALRVHFRLSVERNRPHRRVLIHFDVGRSVHAATGREQDTANAVSFGNLNQHSRGGVVSFQRRALILSAGRITDDRR